MRRPRPIEDEQAEDRGGDQGRGHDQGDVVVRHPHEAPDLVLPVLAQPERDRQQHRGADQEDRPGPAPWRPGVPVGEGAPDPRGDDAQPVPDRRGDAPDHPLDETAAGQQRRGERQARQDECTPAAGQRDVTQSPQPSGEGPRPGLGGRHLVGRHLVGRHLIGRRLVCRRCFRLPVTGGPIGDRPVCGIGQWAPGRVGRCRGLQFHGFPPRGLAPAVLVDTVGRAAGGRQGPKVRRTPPKRVRQPGRRRPRCVSVRTTGHPCGGATSPAGRGPAAPLRHRRVRRRSDRPAVPGGQRARAQPVRDDAEQHGHPDDRDRLVRRRPRAPPGRAGRRPARPARGARTSRRTARCRGPARCRPGRARPGPSAPR